MAVLCEYFSDVPFHGDATYAIYVIPRDVNACIFGSLPINSSIVVLFEDRDMMVSMPFTNIFDPKVINY